MSEAMPMANAGRVRFRRAGLSATAQGRPGTVRLYRIHHALRAMVLGLLLALLAACGARTSPLGIRGYVHGVGDPVQYFKVNGVTGTLLDANGARAQPACCVNLPTEWVPGLTATVEIGYPPSSHLAPKTLQVPVEEYRANARGVLQAHFYPGGRSRLVVSRFAPGHPRYPLVEGVVIDWATYRNYCMLRPSEAVCQVLPLRPDLGVD